MGTRPYPSTQNYKTCLPRPYPNGNKIIIYAYPLDNKLKNCISPYISCNIFKVWLFSSNSKLLGELIFWLNRLHVNYKSNASQLAIIIYHTHTLQSLTFLCACCYLIMHNSHSSGFVFHLFIQLHF